jgi:hypothetical protein
MSPIQGTQSIRDLTYKLDPLSITRARSRSPVPYCRGTSGPLFTGNDYVGAFLARESQKTTAST